MIDFTVETEIARPPATVFAYVTDPAKLATWQTNTLSAVPEPPGPLRLGSRIREVHRGPGGRELESLVEVSELEPDRLFALRMIEGPLPVDARISLDPIEAGTRMRFNVRGEPTGPLRFLRPLMRAALKRQLAEHCRNLKRVLEEPGA
ncbi:MAG TPA: SRPBCC family protein [Solirubrobacteraceae bacterium]|nr:SRPBCC family protein [Solirubrobacteraceae bacterium]